MGRRESEGLFGDILLRLLSFFSLPFSYMAALNTLENMFPGEKKSTGLRAFSL